MAGRVCCMSKLTPHGERKVVAPSPVQLRRIHSPGVRVGVPFGVICVVPTAGYARRRRH